MSIKAFVREAAGLRDEESQGGDEPSWIEPVYATKLAIYKGPQDRLPQKSMPSTMARQLVEDMRALDYNPRLNLATFLTTWMERDAQDVMLGAATVNMADSVQYPSVARMEDRCICMLAHLWNCPDENFTGTGCCGSTEACLLGALACKKIWQRRRREAGLPTDKPNLIFGHNAQVAWQKFSAYWRRAHVRVGVALMCGSTYTGQFEDVERCDAILEEIKEKKGWDVPIHVDAASGGLFAAVLRPELRWDFRNRHVVSINVSGHKYGLVCPGLGFQVWRSRDWVPEDMVFVTDYLGKKEENFSINFSRSGAQVVAQYFQFIRLGVDSYRGIFKNLMAVYDFMVQKLEKTGHFHLLSNGDLPVVSFRLKPLGEGRDRGYDEFDVRPIHGAGLQLSDVKLLRVVLRMGFDLPMAEELVARLKEVIQWLDDKHGSAKRPSQMSASELTHSNEHHITAPC